jgi:hypothetical protein
MGDKDITFILATIKEYIFQRKGVLVEISAPTTPSQMHMMMSAFATANHYLNEQKQKESSP